MNTKLRYIKFLHVLFVICEVSAAIGLVVVLLLAPFLEAMVRGGRANVGLYAGHGSIIWTFRIRLPYGADSSIGNEGARFGRSENPGQEPSFGRMSFGPFQLRTGKGAIPMEAASMKDPSIAIDQLEGTVTFTKPEAAAQALASATWPFVAGMLCTGGVTLAILDLLRRMLKSVYRREVFTAANIRSVQSIGFLIMASAILKLAAGAWLVSRMAAFVAARVATGNVFFETSSQSDVSLATGFLILALAEVFRQGLALKEENQLTI